MRIVGITRVLDEADIIEAFIRHAANFVDHHIIMDNGSRDGTLEIIKNLSAEGFALTVYQTPAITFRESDQLTDLFKEAILQHEADWVACLDADELYDDSRLPNGLREYLSQLDRSAENVVAVRAAWIHYNYTRNDDTSDNLLPRRITHRNRDFSDYKAIMSKRLLSEGGGIHDGSHDAWVPEGSNGISVIQPNLWVCHYGERSPAQYVSKVVRGWSKVLAAGPTVVAQGPASHYRGPFEILRDRPHELLRAEWFLTHKNEGPHLVNDPMPYRGGDLRYTSPSDPEMQAFRALVGHLAEVCSRYGQMIEKVPGAREFSDQTDNDIKHII